MCERTVGQGEWDNNGMALCCGSSEEKYQSKGAEVVKPLMDFRHIPEPQVTELANYVKQRKEHLTALATTSDVRTEITKNITERTQPVDQYPKGRQFLQDEEYLLILRDLLNLSTILDDMEQTGWVPYQNRSTYYILQAEASLFQLSLFILAWVPSVFKRNTFCWMSIMVFTCITIPFAHKSGFIMELTLDDF
ncbi:hypothetical protein CEUSTIGMA_g11520.t1 [Chlamydomonas eustigma]|uniref:Uncharacterized protein n=1 Tax=Chlamydomonas eustigma TaxID=1157962 RepID=A0A250XM01_9CHLO|nr:hypothetical protein CEUSTIGMA_g11520.t1 [Chlamydomonas eustigma]|eukprot:GAX84097.1 hypothetical protein CEUSTIGMA_g11520.t1 [Chlamydomonas eustigma]